MSQAIRPEDLEVGVMFEVEALGTVPLGQTSTVDFLALQKPLRELYLAYQKPSGTTSLPHCRLVVSNRGLAVTDAPTGPQDRTPAAETLYNIPSVVFAAAVKFLIVGKKEKDFRFAFEAIDSEGPPPKQAKGKNDLYVGLDKKWRYLSKVTSHPVICACVMQRMTGVRASELHAFVCESELQARDVIFSLNSALKNFALKEVPAPVPSSSIYGHGFCDYPPQRNIPEAGMRNETEHLLISQQQQQQQPPAKVAGPGEGVYGIQGYSDHMMAYRGAEAVARPGGIKSDPSGPSPWDPRTQDTRPPTTSSSSSSDGQQPGSDWLSHQREQLMRNFTNDQRKNDPLRSQTEQTVYDQQRGIYDMQASRGIYDPMSSRGVYEPQPPKDVYDPQPSKGIYDTHPAIYEYRTPQNYVDPPRENYFPGPAVEGVYGPRRDIYDPQMANRAQGEQSAGNIYGPIRSMSGSLERVFDEPRKAPDLAKTSSETSRMGNDLYRDGGTESEYSRGFAIPRVKVSYDGEPPYNARNESIPNRPISLGNEAGSFPPPHEASADRKNKTKAQPPAPHAKPRSTATSPTSAEANPGLLRTSGGAGYVKPETADRGLSDPLPQSSMPVAAKKVKGIKVFPTIMLRGNQAAAAAAAADEEGEMGDNAGKPLCKDAAYTSHMVENLRSTKQQPNGAGPERQPINWNKPHGDGDTDDQHGQDRRKKTDEIEYTLGNLSVGSNRAGQNSGNDFEQSLGYLP